MKKIASPFLRLTAWLIDLLLQIILYQGLFLLALKNTEPFGLINQTVAAFIFLVLYTPIILTLINIGLISGLGGTVGKILTGIAIENDQGKKLTIKGAFVRNVLGYMVSGLILNLGFIWIAIDKNRQGWHDMMVNTYVVIKSRYAILRGILFVIIFLFINLVFLSMINFQIKLNYPVFNQIFESLKSDFENLPNTKSLIDQVISSPNPTVCSDENTKRSMTYSEARQMALSSECVNEGNLKETYFCNETTGTWWMDLDIKQQGCNPACVVNVNDRSAEINWRCTGAKNI